MTQPDLYSVQGFRVVQVEECWFKSLAPLMAEVRAQMGSGPVYLSFDIDALDPGFAPGTGTPEIAGLTPIQVTMGTPTLIPLSLMVWWCNPVILQCNRLCMRGWMFCAYLYSRPYEYWYLFLSLLDLGSWDYSGLPWFKPCWMWSCGGVPPLRHNGYLFNLYFSSNWCISFVWPLFIYFAQQGTLHWRVPTSFSKCCASSQKWNTSDQ